MNAGERVTTVKAIADQLMWSDWSDIDLTLEHFGVPTSVWDGEKRPYLIEKLKAAPDGQLQALNSYLSGTDAAPADAAKLPWDQVGLFRLFGSHRAEDKVMVGEVKASLAQYGVDLFVAHQDIKPSKEWIAEIELALGTCDALVAFLTPSFRTSDWCDQEVGFAIKNRVLIVPVCMGQVPYGFMGRYQGLKAEAMKPPEVAKAIFDILVSNELTADRMADAIVSYVAEARSFDQANQGSRLLPLVSQWTPARLRKLEESVESNLQVSGAFDAPGRIRAIIRRHSGQQAQ